MSIDLNRFHKQSGTFHRRITKECILEIEVYVKDDWDPLLEVAQEENNNLSLSELQDISFQPTSGISKDVLTLPAGFECEPEERRKMQAIVNSSDWHSVTKLVEIIFKFIEGKHELETKEALQKVRSDTCSYFTVNQFTNSQ